MYTNFFVPSNICLLEIILSRSFVRILPLSSGLVLQIEEIYHFFKYCSLYLRMCIFCSTFANGITLSKKMKVGLVLEGGGMRGLYTAGVLDVMMDNHFMPDVVCGTSAGVTFGVNLLSQQCGRVLRYNCRYVGERRYKALLRTIEQRNEQYNARIQQIRQLEQEGKVFVIRPSEDRPVGRLEKDPEKLKALHALGMLDAQKQWQALEDYLEE